MIIIATTITIYKDNINSNDDQRLIILSKFFYSAPHEILVHFVLMASKQIQSPPLILLESMPDCSHSNSNQAIIPGS